ncbi:hypothetical protein QOT17_014627 [Balamuthia mandrillaris]
MKAIIGLLFMLTVCTLAYRCNDCLKHNIIKQGFHPLKTIHATYPFDYVVINLFGPLPTSSKGFYYHSDVDHTLYQVVSDLRALMMSGFEHQFISAYHPRANRAAESHVKLACNTLNKLINSDWSHWHNLSSCCPICNEPIHYLLSQLPTKTLLLENAKQMHDIVYPASESSTQKHSSNIKAQHDSSVPLHEFSTPKYFGPYTVICHNSGSAYLLQDSTGVTLLDKFSPNQLKLVALPRGLYY